MTTTTLFFTTDLHGSEKCFLKFLNAPSFYGAKIIIVGGDVTGKMMIPIVKQADGTYRANVWGRDTIIKSEKDLEETETALAYSGYYPFRTTPDEKQTLDQDPSKVDKLFTSLMQSRLEHWLELANRKFRRRDMKCFITPGNDDRFDIDALFEKSDVVVNPEGKVVSLDDHHEMISSGFANKTPWDCPRDITEEALAERIDRMASKVSNMTNCIFNLHCPPFDSGLDSAPRLDKDLRPVLSSGGEPEMIPVGSKTVREAIEKHQPVLGLHGHIHESKGITRIGRTVCINPGSEYAEGIIRGALIVLDQKGVKTHQLTTG